MIYLSTPWNAVMVVLIFTILQLSISSAFIVQASALKKPMMIYLQNISDTSSLSARRVRKVVSS